MKIKKMVYKPERNIELLYNNIYKGYHYYILSLGTHPTAYVELSKNHKFFNKSYWGIEEESNILVHGGFTYSENGLQIGNNTTLENSWFIGWDYAHCDDYYCFPDDFYNDKDQKKWTTKEIIKDCENVIDQLEKEDS